METPRAENEAFSKAQRSLSPYIRSRQETAHIRRLLTLHLRSHIDNGSSSLTPPLSLVNSSTTLLPSAAKSHGLQKEYLRALKANVKAQQEYEKLSRRERGNASSDRATENASMDPYISFVKQKQKLERLRILQDYLEGLSNKLPAVTSFLDGPLPTTSGLPRLPADVISSASHSAPSSSVNLSDLIQDLEKDVLRAKVLLQTEKKLLDKIQSDQKRAQRRESTQAANAEQILKALGRTRNELINWVEEELGKAGDISDGAAETAPENVSDKMIEDAVDEVRAKYAKYVESRRHFIDVTRRPLIQPVEASSSHSDDALATLSAPETDDMVRFITPYLSELVDVSLEQKSLTQQRSYLTTSLAKHNKDTLQVFDRLGEESHLLVKYPSPSGGAGMASTFAAEMGMAVKENPGVSHKAKEWTNAAEAASLDTMEAVCISVDEGKAAIEEARRVLGSLEDMLGYDMSSGGDGADEGDIWMQEVESKSPEKPARRNIWSRIDGGLGALDGTR